MSSCRARASGGFEAAPPPRTAYGGQAQALSPLTPAPLTPPAAHHPCSPAPPAAHPAQSSSPQTVHHGSPQTLPQPQGRLGPACRAPHASSARPGPPQQARATPLDHPASPLRLSFPPPDERAPASAPPLRLRDPSHAFPSLSVPGRLLGLACRPGGSRRGAPGAPGLRTCWPRAAAAGVSLLLGPTAVPAPSPSPECRSDVLAAAAGWGGAEGLGEERMGGGRGAGGRAAQTRILPALAQPRRVGLWGLAGFPSPGPGPDPLPPWGPPRPGHAHSLAAAGPLWAFVSGAVLKPQAPGTTWKRSLESGACPAAGSPAL